MSVHLALGSAGLAARIWIRAAAAEANTTTPHPHHRLQTQGKQRFLSRPLSLWVKQHAVSLSRFSSYAKLPELSLICIKRHIVIAGKNSLAHLSQRVTGAILTPWAPQNVTRTVARTTSAPPAFAPTAPKSARNTSHASETATARKGTGVMSTISRVQHRTDRKCCCRGQRRLQRVCGSDLRDAELRMGTDSVSCHQLLRHLSRQTGLDATLDIDLGQVLCSKATFWLSSVRSRVRSQPPLKQRSSAEFPRSDVPAGAICHVWLQSSFL